jgi:hypothetical protein
MKYGNLKYFDRKSYNKFGLILDTGATLSHFPDEHRKMLYAQV